MAYTTTRKKIRSEVNSQVYTGPHNGLAGRDAANAHPMMSITGLEAELASIQSHIGDVDIHYAMDQISITESQISDLQAYLPLAGGTLSGELRFISNMRNSFYTNDHNGAIYTADASGLDFPFEGNTNANMIIQNRSSADRNIVFVTGSTPAVRMSINHNQVRCYQELEVDSALHSSSIISSGSSTGYIGMGHGIRGSDRAELALFSNGNNPAEIQFGINGRSDLNTKWAISSRDTDNLRIYEAPYNTGGSWSRVLDFLPGGNITMYGDLAVDNDLTVGGDTILSALAGGGTRTLKIDNNGKVFAE